MNKKRKQEVTSVCPCCKGINGLHDDWCTPNVRADVRDCVAGDLPDGAYLALSEEMDVEP